MPTIVGKQVGPIAYGMMGLTISPTPKDQCFDAMRAALDSGCNFFNGGTFYGTPEWNSVTLLVEYLKKYPEDADKIVLSIKSGFDYANKRGVGSPEAVKRELDTVLKQLEGVKKVDVFECARVDPDVPIEVTLQFLQDEYVSKGLIGGVALSEVAAATIRRAVKVTKIVLVENEVSLWSTDVLTNGVAATCAELDIPILAYSPIGKGMLSGRFKTLDDIPKGDHRHFWPRFYPENFDNNVKLVDKVRKLAEKKGCTPAQLAINWVRSLSGKSGMPQFIPLPGSTNDTRVRENAFLTDLTVEELEVIDGILANFTTAGDRYPAGFPTEG